MSYRLKRQVLKLLPHEVDLYQHLVSRFIHESRLPIFRLSDRRKLSEFMSSEEVIVEASNFVTKIDAIWAQKYPTKPLADSTKRTAIRRGDSMTIPTKVDSESNPVVDQGNKAEDTNTLKPGQIPSANQPRNKVKPAPPEFHLPNCKVGVRYDSEFSVSGPSQSGVQIVSAKIPPELGLQYIEETNAVSGTPLVPGEFDIELLWCSNEDAGKSRATCRLIVNPDPRSLWKVIEPPVDAPFQKINLQDELIECDGFSMVAASRRGRSHEHAGSFRDDDFFISHIPNSDWNILIVADGAGSARYSREGSRLAVTTAGDAINSELSGDFGVAVSALIESWDKDESVQRAIGEKFHFFYHNIATRAVTAIEEVAASENAAVKDFSTTLLIAIVKMIDDDMFIATFWLGDGAIAAYGPNSSIKLMGVPDTGEFAGQTRFLDRSSLSDSGFGKRIRIGKFSTSHAILLMTDGVSDPYFETDNGLADPLKWDALMSEILPILCSSDPSVNLLDWLHFFKQGHHDDRTLVALVPSKKG